MATGTQMVKHSALDELAKQTDIPLALMTRPPADGVTRNAIGDQMWTGVLLRFQSVLSERDAQLWQNPPMDVSQSPEHLRILHEFDDFVLHQFGEFGWRLMMSAGALQRISEWEKHSPEMLERLGSELAFRSRVLRGEKSARLVGDIEKFADGAIEELGRLLRRQRDEFGARPVVPDCARLAAWMKLEIESKAAEFPLLHAELAQLIGWVESLGARNRRMAGTLLRGEMRAQGFFYQWYADSSNRSVKDVRNMISKRRTKR